MSTGKVLIAGATGKQGGWVVRNLLSMLSGPSLAILNRLPQSPWLSKGLNLPRALSQRMQSSLLPWKAAFPLFSSQMYVTESLTSGGPRTGGGDAEAEIQQGKTFIDAAEKAELKHLVFLRSKAQSAILASRSWDRKFQVEEYLRASGLPSYTILRPASFMKTSRRGRASPLFSPLACSMLLWQERNSSLSP
jgi:hypothetical protein